MWLVALAVALTAERSSAQPDWTRRNPVQSPPARYFHDMACDTARGQVVMFGGSFQGTLINDTWTWDGTTWTQRTPASSPPARSGHAMVYDVARQRVLLYGGTGASGYQSDTWTWDGIRWTQHAPALSPPARSGHAMTYDASRQRVVLFGGGGNSGNQNDTWEWDGTTWTQRVSTTGPSPRHGHAMAYDTVRQRVLLFGGWYFLNDTWEWDGTAWTQRTPAVSPTNRMAYCTVAYDAIRGRGLLFPGGNLYSPWEWDGTTWTERLVPTIPSWRYGHAMVHDASRQGIVMFGGLGSTSVYLNETWEYGFAGSLAQSGTPRPGGTVQLRLTARGQAGRPYQVGSSLGNGPILIGYRALGLSLDPLFKISVTGACPWIFEGYQGVLGSRGDATARIVIPNLGALVGLTIHSAFITQNPVVPCGIQSISNTVSTLIT